MSNRLILLFLLVGLFAINPYCAAAQDSTSVDTIARPNYKLLRKIFAIESAAYVGSLYSLSKSWYKNPLRRFHFYNDGRNWLQMDKAGHIFTAYQIARHSSEIYRSTGISKKQRLIYSGISGVIFQTPIEILDGFSPDYGFSLTDMIANISGSGLFVLQQLLWDEIRVQPKYSFHQTPLARLRPQLLGHNVRESWLKDYNGQTYWLSFSPRVFVTRSNWPSWFCLSVGYGIGNMIYADGQENLKNGYSPYRQFYLSVDVDITKVKMRSKFLRSLGFIVNSIKVPAPALQLSKKGIAFKPLYF